MGCVFHGAVRAHYHTSRLAATGMIARQQGLIINISFWAAQNMAATPHGVSKAATDKLTADMAVDFAPYKGSPR